jgi:ABC-type transporter Mla subunit MlaD
LLLDLGAVARQLLPILGAVALVYLCVVLRRLTKMLEETTNVIKNLDPAVKSVNASLEKVQVPLDTVIKYSHTLDDMHDRTVDSVARMAENASDSVDKMKDYVVGKLQSLDNYDEVRPYNPETDK